ncbi:hypothetical protein LSM04_008145 [Trypanosoma melophagium]|uniref:uncharacterized protein n=1 Tax=Trypanosoma melophagium TaxID=715481 RepID=UPI00351A24FD|nr:hypothetical protein LSM04_008145 [Trypanosoma melophagium]
MRGSVFLGLLVLAALLVSHSVSAQSSKSKHVMVFSGPGWDSVVKSDSAGLRAALIADIGVQLDRAYAFDTTVTVDSLSTCGRLQVDVTVQQTVLQGVPEPSLQHIWTAEEVNSLIEQGKFATTLAMYPGPDTAARGCVRIPGEGKELSECTGVCKGMIVMGAVIVGLMALIFLVTLSCVCCCIKRSKPSPNEPHRDSIDWRQ